MSAIAEKEGCFYFINAPGRTDKTFLISLILVKVRSECNIVLAIAASEIVAILLDGG